MVINISIHDSVKILLNTFDVLTFIQMRTHEYELWQIKKTNGDEYVQVRRDFNN